MTKAHDLSNLKPNDIEHIREGTWSITDHETNTEYFIKRCTPEEVSMTIKASTFDGLPPDSNFKLPNYIGSSKCLPDGFHNLFPITEANNQDINGLPTSLRGNPLTQVELDGLVRDVTILNDAGIFNHDFMNNLFVERGVDGHISFYSIDFEPHIFDQLHLGQLEDVAQVKEAIQDIIKAGITEHSFPETYPNSLAFALI